jgi:hypothetical protein
VPIRDWEIIADKLSNAGWTWGCVATIDCSGRTIFVADAHRDDGKRFIVRSDEKLTAFICSHLWVMHLNDLQSYLGSNTLGP